LRFETGYLDHGMAVPVVMFAAIALLKKQEQ
jgi:hypothetical protein